METRHDLEHITERLTEGLRCPWKWGHRLAARLDLSGVSGVKQAPIRPPDTRLMDPRVFLARRPGSAVAVLIYCAMMKRRVRPSGGRPGTAIGARPVTSHAVMIALSSLWSLWLNDSGMVIYGGPSGDQRAACVRFPIGARR